MRQQIRGKHGCSEATSAYFSDDGIDFINWQSNEDLLFVREMH